MNSRSRSVATVVLAAVLTVQIAPTAIGSPRDDRDGIVAKIGKVVKTVQRFFGLTPLDTEPTPPRP